MNIAWPPSISSWFDSKVENDSVLAHEVGKPRVGRHATASDLSFHGRFHEHYKQMHCVGGYVDGDYDAKTSTGKRNILEGRQQNNGYQPLAVIQTSDARSRDHGTLAIVGDRLIGIEVKSGWTTSRDRTARLGRPDRQAVRASGVAVRDIWPVLSGPLDTALTVDGMARLLWASEIEALVGKPVVRAEGLDLIRQKCGLAELRVGVRAALRSRAPNKWEEAFWIRFDGEAQAKTPAGQAAA